MVSTMSGGSPSAARLTLSRAKPTETSSLSKGDKHLAPDSPGLCEKGSSHGLPYRRDLSSTGHRCLGQAGAII